MKSLVSILIPAYNAEKWLADTVKSAIEQTWPRKEIIIVDDGSTDETLAVARQFASRGVAVVTQRHQGAAAARNYALALSQGDYIQWLDADDLLSPGKIANQMKVAEECQNPRMLLSSGWGTFAYQIDRVKILPTSLWSDLSPVEWLIRKMRENLHMQTATWLVSRELTEASGPWDVRLFRDNDGEYFCRVLLASDGIRFVCGANVFYRITSSRRVSYIGRSDTKKDSMFLSMKLHVRYIQSLEESDRVRVACTTYLQNWLLHFFPERPDIVEDLEKLAAQLGGRLTTPRLHWKYAWIKRFFGWSAAKRAQLALPRLKQSLVRLFDGAMFELNKLSRSSMVERDHFEFLSRSRLNSAPTTGTANECGGFEISGGVNNQKRRTMCDAGPRS